MTPGRRLNQIAVIALQLGLIFGAASRYSIEQGFGFQRLVPLILVAFVVHALCPPQHRHWVFLVASLVAIELVIPFPHSVGLIAAGGSLFWIAHLPLSLRARILLLGVAGAALAGVRVGLVETPWRGLRDIVLPVLASMFMFRLAVYMYDARNEAQPAPLAQRLSYFFMIPNVAFLLFPVVDYKAFRRTYYNADELAIYEKGLSWVLRGVTHLLLYRIVYQFLVPNPNEIQGIGDVVQFAVTSYLLYLRISGQFHLIVGVLCLFGYNLPETHHLYYLASSFNDFWRRINIYWKDFMMKLFYYPAFMRLRSLGVPAALTIATCGVFLGTWILHSYQWFWLRGTFPVAATDIVFWGILGVLVVFNSLRELHRDGRRYHGTGQWNLGIATRRSAQSVAMFLLLALLWSLWSSQSLGDWWRIMLKATSSPAWQFLLVGFGVAALVGVGVLLQYWGPRVMRPTPAFKRFQHPALRTVGLSAVLLAMSFRGVYGRLGERTIEVVDAIRADRLNFRDKELADRGYYEGLLNAGGYMSSLWIAQRGRPQGREWAPQRQSETVRQTGDDLEYEFIPGFNGSYKDAPFSVNRWGMRDREYDLSAPRRVRRIALLGASYEVGAGVPNDSTWEAVFEGQLNRTRSPTDTGVIEILNFAVGGYSTIQKLAILERKVPPFAPDLVIHTVYSSEDVRLMMYLSSLVRLRIGSHYQEIQSILDEANVRWTMEGGEIWERLLPFRDRALTWSLQAMKRASDSLGLPLVTLYMPQTEGDSAVGADRAEYLWEVLGESGLEPIAVADPFAGWEGPTLFIAPWDRHPNSLGHRLIADAVKRAIPPSLIWGSVGQRF